MDIAANVQRIFHTIRTGALQAGRDPQSVQLIAVTKYVEAQRVQEAIAAGITVCGENRLQEAQAKMETLAHLRGVTWHFIGRVQRRKLRHIVGRFALIHSIESLEQIQELDQRAKDLGLCQAILLQVNIGNEPTKGGFSEQALLKVIPNMSAYPHVKIQGLMAIPPWSENPEAVRPYFQRLRHLAEKVKTFEVPGVEMKELSMGMSHDFVVAVQEGATMVRLGSAIFGPRPN